MFPRVDSPDPCGDSTGMANQSSTHPTTPCPNAVTMSQCCTQIYVHVFDDKHAPIAGSFHFHRQWNVEEAAYRWNWMVNSSDACVLICGPEVLLQDLRRDEIRGWWWCSLEFCPIKPRCQLQATRKQTTGCSRLRSSYYAVLFSVRLMSDDTKGDCAYVTHEFDGKRRHSRRRRRLNSATQHRSVVLFGCASIIVSTLARTPEVLPSLIFVRGTDQVERGVTDWRPRWSVSTQYRSFAVHCSY